MPLSSERIPTDVARTIRLYALRAGRVGLALALVLAFLLTLLITLVLASAAAASVPSQLHSIVVVDHASLASTTLANWLPSLAFPALLGFAASGDGRTDVDRLIEGVEAVADGNYDVSFDVDRDDEVGRLADALDGLAESIAERERGYEEYEAFRDDLLDSVDDVFYVLDKNSEHRKWNQTWCTVTGYSDEEVAQMHPLDFFEGDDVEKVRASIEEGFETGHSRVEADLVTADGDSVPHEFVASRVEAPDGAPVLVGVARDVSDRRNHQRERAESERYRQRLYEITSDPTLDGDEKLRDLLELGCERLDVENGNVTRIDPEAGTHEVLHAAGSSLVEAGAVAPLDETFCRETIQADGILDVEDASTSGLANNPAYERLGVRSYVGAKLFVEDDLFGTLCFVDTEPREEPFTPDEKTFVDLIARWISQVYERDAHTEALRRTDRAMEAAPVGITIHGPLSDGFRIRYANEAFEEITGYDAEAVVGEPWKQFLLGDEASSDVIDRLQTAVSEERTATEEVQVGRADGAECWRRVHVAPVEAPAGEPTEFVVFHEDVTDRVEAQRRLEEEKERFESIVQSVQEYAIFGLDADGTIQSWNVGAEQLTGYGADEVVGEHVSTFYAASERDADLPDEHLEAAVESGSVENEIAHRREDGSQFWASVTLTALRNDDGSLRGFAVVTRDMTDRKSYEERLAAASESVSRLEAAETESEISQTVCSIVDEILDEPLCMLWTYDAAQDALVPIAGTDEAVALAEDVNSGDPLVLPADGAEMEIVREGESRVVEDYQSLEGATYPTAPVGTMLKVPLDGDGLLAVAYRDVREVDPATHELVEILGKHAGASLERVEREERLARYKEFTDDVMDSLNDLFYVVGQDLQFERWNDRLREVTGYTDDEIESLQPQDLVVEADQAAIADVIEDTFDTGSGRVEARILTSDGEEIPYEFVASALEDPDDEPVLVGIGRDISQRRERQRRLEALVENTTDPIYIKDREGRYTFANQAAADYFGLAPEDVLGETDSELFDEQGEQVARDDDQHVLETGEPIRNEVSRVIDGEVHVFLDHKYPYRDDEGEIVGVMGISRDVTERVDYERMLEARSAAMEESIDGIAILNEDEEYVFANQAHADVYGYDDPEALVGENWQMCYSEEMVEHAETDILPELAQTGSWRGEAVGQRADGSTYPQELSLTLLDDGRMICVVRDVTDRKEREHELARNRALLQQAQRAARIGGWELDLRAEPPEMTWTDQLYDIHDVERGTEIDMERTLEFYHPEDRPRISETIDMAIEEGEPYDMEARLQTEKEEERWIRAIAEPVEEDGEVVALRGSIQDITDHKGRERELERTKDLLQQAQRMGGVGGWELDVSEQPYQGNWTEELFRIFEIEPREPFPMDEVYEYVHPEERDWVRAEITRGIESGEHFSLENRIVTGEGNVRWIRVVGEPVGSGEAIFRGAILDVTEQKERELILESLHETARGLLQTQTTTEVAELAVDTAQEVLDVPCTAVYVLDDASGHLQPVAYNEGFEEHCGGPDASSSGRGDSLLWEAYVSESPTSLSESALDAPGIFDGPIEESIYIPIGDHGVFVVASPEHPVDRGTRRVAETLVATMEAALHRLDSEADLRERETELAAQNRRLRRQIQINEIIRTVDQSLIGASDREEIETAVCERLTEGDDVAFAWIGAVDTTGDDLVPRAWAGTSHDYLDAISLELGSGTADPAVQTATTGESTVVESVVEAVKTEDWRKNALVSNFSSAVAVPIAFDEYTYGVLAVYGTEPDQFGDLERAVFEELGESIANSINAVETRQALYTDSFVELTVRFDDADDFLARVAREAGAEVDYVGLGTHSEDESRVFFDVEGAEPEAVLEMLGDTVAVDDHRLIGETGDRHLFEATVAGEVLAARLVRLGGVPRSITARARELEVTVDVPATIDVREFVETLREQYPSAELVARRDVHRDVETRQELVNSLFEELTERQIEVLRTAYFAGFFGWPRESTGEEIAELLDVSQPTVNRHVRHGLHRLLEQLFDEEPATIAQAQ